MDLRGTDFDLSIESSVIGDIGVPSMRFHDLERTGVDLVHSESGVEVGERRERGTDPVGGERRSSLQQARVASGPARLNRRED